MTKKFLDYIGTKRFLDNIKDLINGKNFDASKITSGTIDIERLPQGALERLITVEIKPLDTH